MEELEAMRRKILAVDDEPDQLKLVDQLLQGEGFAIDTAANGAEALKKVYRSRPDLILVDASMPVMNGFTFCESLRKDPTTTDIPVLMLTGLRSQFDRLNGFAHGANAYLCKPFTPDELVATVKTMLRLSAGVPGQPVAQD